MGCCSVWRIVQSVVGIFLGLSCGTIFFLQYGNYQASAWAFASALVAAAALHLAILLHKQTLDQWYHSYHVENIQLMAFVLSDVTVGLFAWYLFYALYFKIPMMPIGTSTLIASVWVSMTAKWSILLWFYARKCVYQLQPSGALCLSDEFE